MHDTIDLPALVERSAIQANSAYRASLVERSPAPFTLADHFAAMQTAYLEQLVSARAACTSQRAIDTLDRRTARETELLARPAGALAKLRRSIIDAVESRVTVELDADGDVRDIDPSQVVLDITEAADAWDWEFDEEQSVDCPAVKAGIDEESTHRVKAAIVAVKWEGGRCVAVVEVGEDC